MVLSGHRQVTARIYQSVCREQPFPLFLSTKAGRVLTPSSARVLALLSGRVHLQTRAFACRLCWLFASSLLCLWFFFLSPAFLFWQISDLQKLRERFNRHSVSSYLDLLIINICLMWILHKWMYIYVFWVCVFACTHMCLCGSCCVALAGFLTPTCMRSFSLSSLRARVLTHHCVWLYRLPFWAF